MHIQEEFQNSPAIVTELKCPLFNSPNIMDLCNRINCWRLDVDACTPCGSPPTTFQSRGSMSGLSSSSSTRVRGNARSRPYSSHPRRPQSVYVIGFTSEFDNRHGPTRTMQHHERPSVPLPEHPLARVPECGNSSRVSLRTPSIREVPTTGHGLDLPHPEWNPLITHHPEIVKEEYYRILGLFRRLNTERRKTEFQLVQCLSPSKEARQHLMDIGIAIQHVVAAAQYIVDYSNSHGWDIDFDALLYDDLVPPVKMMPSRMRELVCSTGHASGSELGWHFQPAA